MARRTNQRQPEGLADAGPQRPGSRVTAALAAVLFALIAAAFVLLPVAVRAQEPGTAVVTVEEGDASDAPPGTTVWDVYVSGAEELYGLDIELQFDAGQAQVVGPEVSGRIQVQLGPFLEPGFVVENRVNNEAGVIRAVFTQMSPAEPVSGDGVLLTVVLEAHDGAEVMPEVSAIVLARVDGAAQPVSLGDDESAEPPPTPGQLEEQPTPVPTPVPTEAPGDGTPASGGGSSGSPGGDATPGPDASPDVSSGEPDAGGEADDDGGADPEAATSTAEALASPDVEGESADGSGNGDDGDSLAWLAWLVAGAIVLGGAIAAVVILQRRSAR